MLPSAIEERGRRGLTMLWRAHVPLRSKAHDVVWVKVAPDAEAQRHDM
jgi:hypothetical protein